MTVVNTQLV